MLAAMDGCLGPFKIHQHDIKNKQAQVLTEEK